MKKLKKIKIYLKEENINFFLNSFSFKYEKKKVYPNFLEDKDKEIKILKKLNEYEIGKIITDGNKEILPLEEYLSIKKKIFHISKKNILKDSKNITKLNFKKFLFFLKVSDFFFIGLDYNRDGGKIIGKLENFFIKSKKKNYDVSLEEIKKELKIFLEKKKNFEELNIKLNSLKKKILGSYEYYEKKIKKKIIEKRKILKNFKKIKKIYSLEVFLDKKNLLKLESFSKIFYYQEFKKEEVTFEFTSNFEKNFIGNFFTQEELTDKDEFFFKILYFFSSLIFSFILGDIGLGFGYFIFFFIFKNYYESLRGIFILIMGLFYGEFFSIEIFHSVLKKDNLEFNLIFFLIFGICLIFILRNYGNLIKIIYGRKINFLFENICNGFLIIFILILTIESRKYLNILKFWSLISGLYFSINFLKIIDFFKMGMDILAYVRIPCILLGDNIILSILKNLIDFDKNTFLILKGIFSVFWLSFLLGIFLYQNLISKISEIRLLNNPIRFSILGKKINYGKLNKYN